MRLLGATSVWVSKIPWEDGFTASLCSLLHCLACFVNNVFLCHFEQIFLSIQSEFLLPLVTVVLHPFTSRECLVLPFPFTFLGSGRQPWVYIPQPFPGSTASKHVTARPGVIGFLVTTWLLHVGRMHTKALSSFWCPCTVSSLMTRAAMNCWV